MLPTIPEMHKQPGVCYAVTDDGLELPVIDITHCAFHKIHLVLQGLLQLGPIRQRFARPGIKLYILSILAVSRTLVLVGFHSVHPVFLQLHSDMLSSCYN